MMFCLLPTVCTNALDINFIASSKFSARSFIKLHKILIEKTNNYLYLNRVNLYV